jgi:cap2 methyltransferase
MFSYNLTPTSLGIKSTLPATNKWLNPNYAGPGDYLAREAAGNDMAGINNPTKWRQDFPTYSESIPRNMEIKNQLNEVKAGITKVKAEGHEQLYTTVAAAFNKYESLRGRNGELAKRFGAEIVSNAWMKMYETMTLVDLPKTGEWNTFHIAEAPGNFILAINHYVYNHRSQMHWNWYANSFKDIFGSKDGQYLDDNYGIMKSYPDKWLYGADSDGDITSPANIETFAETFPQTLNFVTSDVKYVPLVEDYNEEENQNIPVQMGHLLISLRTLKKGGTALLKEFTFMETAKIAQLWLLACVFKELQIIKPVTSRPANSEVYVLCKGYKANLTELQMLRLTNYMRYIRYLTDGAPSLFQLSDIPKAFVGAVIKLNEQLADQQKTGIKRNLELVYAYKQSQKSDIQRDANDESRTRHSEEWIKKVGIDVLPPHRHIVVAVPENTDKPRRFQHPDGRYNRNYRIQSYSEFHPKK